MSPNVQFRLNTCPTRSAEDYTNHALSSPHHQHFPSIKARIGHRPLSAQWLRLLISSGGSWQQPRCIPSTTLYISPSFISAVYGVIAPATSSIAVLLSRAPLFMTTGLSLSDPPAPFHQAFQIHPSLSLSPHPTAPSPNLALLPYSGRRATWRNRDVTPMASRPLIGWCRC